MNTNNWKIWKSAVGTILARGLVSLMVLNPILSGSWVLGQSEGITRPDVHSLQPGKINISEGLEGAGIHVAGNVVYYVDEVYNSAGAASKMEETRIYLGVLLSDLSPALRSQLKIRKNSGVLVERVLENSPASKAGIQQFDILTHIDDQILINNKHLISLLATFDAGASVKVHYIRQARPEVVVVQLEEKSFVVDSEFQAPVWREDPSEVQSMLLDKPSGNPIRLEVDPTVPMDALGKILNKQINQTMPSPSGMQKTRMFNDGQRMVTISGKDGEVELTVKERSGEIIFQGPVGSDESYLKEIPEIHREAVKRYVDKFGRPTEPSRVPLLSDLPIVGRLFDGSSSQDVCIRHLQKLGIQAMIHKDQQNRWPEKPEHFGLSSLEAETITCPGNGPSQVMVRDMAPENAAELYNKHKIFDYIIHKHNDKESDVAGVILECPWHSYSLYRDGSVQRGPR